MRYSISALLVAGLCLAGMAGCSNDKKVGQPPETAPPAPVQKGKPPPTQAQK